MRQVIFLLPFLATQAVAAGPFDAVKGSWRGAVQIDARHEPKAHAVGTLSLHIGADGAIHAVHNSGCKVAGIVQRSGTHVYSVDGRFTSCPFADYNRRWSGTLAHYPTEGVLKLSWRASEIGLGRPGKTFDAAGTLQR
jgi:hypothetical protein